MLNSWDARRDFIIPGDANKTIDFALEHWISSAQKAIQQRGRFMVALSGGSTPKAIYEKLIFEKLDWSKIWLFWSDERAVPPDNTDSNYHMAMQYFNQVPIPPSQIFRMCAEKEIERNALDYEEKIRIHVGKHLFDLVMLGVGEDGHTASLFPNTAALQVNNRLVVANYVEAKKTWRMTFTFSCINESFHSCIYAIGANKKFIVPQVLNAPILSEFPSSNIGTAHKKCLWILDSEAAENLK